jgi:rRNA processing protein Krr1/Pno1
VGQTDDYENARNSVEHLLQTNLHPKVSEMNREREREMKVNRAKYSRYISKGLSDWNLVVECQNAESEW